MWVIKDIVLLSTKQSFAMKKIFFFQYQRVFFWSKELHAVMSLEIYVWEFGRSPVCFQEGFLCSAHCDSYIHVWGLLINTVCSEIPGQSLALSNSCLFLLRKSSWCGTSSLTFFVNPAYQIWSPSPSPKMVKFYVFFAPSFFKVAGCMVELHLCIEACIALLNAHIS